MTPVESCVICGVVRLAVFFAHDRNGCAYCRDLRACSENHKARADQFTSATPKEKP